MDAANRENVVETIPDLIYAIDCEGRLLQWNRRLEEVTGLSGEELRGRDALDFFAPYERERVAEAIADAFREGYGHIEADLIHADGTARPYHYSGVPLRNNLGEVVGLTGVGRDISDRREAEKRTAVLLEVARDTSGTLDLGELLERVQRRTADVLACDTVMVLYRYPGEEDFRLISQIGMPPELAANLANVTFPSIGPFGGRVPRGECVVVDDAAQTSPAMAGMQGVALVLAPLRVRGRHLGTLIGSRRQGAPKFSPADAQLCESIAHQLALAMETTELYRAQQEEAQVSGALARVGQELMQGFDGPGLLDRLCRITVEVLGCESSHTILFVGDAGTFTAVASHGYQSELWESMRTLQLPTEWLSGMIDDFTEPRQQASSEFSDDLRHIAEVLGIRSSLAVPLRRGDRVIGFHAACYRTREQVFTPLQARIAAGIGQLASLGLEHSRALEALERASRVKSEFVATMSHELRTPLNVILGYHSLLLEGAWGTLSGEQLEVLGRAEQSARQLLELITETLDLSRLEAGRVSVDPTEVALEQVIEAVEEETRSLWERPSLETVWDVAPDLPRLWTDPLKLKVVLKNLVTNALKYTEAGTVALTATRRGEEVEICIADTGPGISAAALPHIFEPFSQGDGSSKRGHGGVGLGLHIVRRLLDLIEGRVSVESELGRGSVFRVHLPLRWTATERR